MRELESAFVKGLSQLDMSLEANPSNILLTSDLEITSISINFYQRFALERAKKIGADAVFFRNNLSSDESSIAQVYIFDFTRSHKEEKDLIELHKNVWSSTDVRIYFIIYNSEIKIFNSSKPVEINKQGIITLQPFDVLKIIGEAKEKYYEYSGKRFIDGSFWENHGDEFSYNNTAYEKLITELRNARKLFLRDITLDKKLANKLLVLSILVKYLEERIDIDRNGYETRVFSKDIFNKPEFGFSESFVDVIRNGLDKNNTYILNVFDFLTNHFSGNIFNILNEYRDDVKRVNLSPLINFLSAELDNNQYVLWKLYSFNYLPVELISSIYEEMLEADKSEGVAYTPSYLVNLLVDECMPMNEPKQSLKILDPACGSGIFLVSAFKRLVDWWRVSKFKETNNWIKPSREHLSHLQELLINSIYGIDISSEAVDLATFSLSLSLCDMLSPKVIWEDLKFNDLRNNIICSDFYSWGGNNKSKQFDLIIGNPPFIEYTGKLFKKHLLSSNLEDKINFPNNQSALLFTLIAASIINNNSGILCFVLPAGPLLYNNSKIANEFREYLFNNYNIPQIIDFTYLSNSLFKNKGNEKNVAVAAFFIRNSKIKFNKTMHIVAKKLKTIRQRHYFEFDHYDIHPISIHDAATNTTVWKSNLLGGGRLLSLLERIKSLPTLKEFLDSKKPEGLVYGEGYTKRKPDMEVTNEELTSGQYKASEAISESMTFDVSSFTEEGIKNIKQQNYKYFYRTGNPKQFKHPLLLIKKNIGQNSIPMYLSENIDFSYTKEVMGIHCPDKNLLRILYNRIKNNNFYRFCILATSARSGISRSTKTILQKDLLHIPFPNSENELVLSYIDNIIINDTMVYWLDYLSKDKENQILKCISQDDLNSFAEVFCNVLNKLFHKADDHMSYQMISSYTSDINALVRFSYKPGKKTNKHIDNQLNFQHINLMMDKGQRSAFSKIIKFYDGNDIYLIKPLEKKYWLRSTAVKDADEVIVDLFNAGY
ncbi:HsdM family class I SAM-dependent methyltransferase [Hymenobacter crusticola]|uniref:site-specific DNA-methyltransferase (adenine-specific) n=1 Tax=Hymenobacter crusticola TaxID=1770526 RepID=A0A243W6E5_9BACT|nr:N-6 DNA methylase [Hymenobacter crusticola]OUJ69401.1 hypothetical protein BXP70_26560 [Hymenobacter crusticola]